MKKTVGKMFKVRKVSKMKDVYKPYKVLGEAQINAGKRDELITIVQERYEERFGNRAHVVVENVTKLLGTVQARMNAHQDPLQLAKNEKQAQALIDILAGAHAIQRAGAGASMALKSYVQQVQAEKEGLSPEQAEIEALKYAGHNSSAAQDVDRDIHQFQQAVQSGNEQQADAIKQKFARLYSFYQTLQAKMSSQGQQAQQPIQQNPQQQNPQHPVAQRLQQTPAPVAPAQPRVQ